jgi:flagellar basal body rod protein FlgG
VINLNTALGGLERAAGQVDKTASRIAQPATAADTVDLSTEMVSLMQARADFEANTKSLKTEDQMTRAALDLIG